VLNSLPELQEKYKQVSLESLKGEGCPPHLSPIRTKVFFLKTHTLPFLLKEEGTRNT